MTKQQTAQSRIVVAGIVATGGITLVIITALLIGSLAAVTGITALMAVAVLGIAAMILMRVTEVHLLVNSRLTAVIDRVDQLTGALDKAGVEVPNVPPQNVIAMKEAQRSQTSVTRAQSCDPEK
jgi:hypothetical protein